MPSIEIPDELIHEIVITALTGDFHRTSDEVARLKRIRKIEGLLNHEAEDLKNSKRVRKAAKRLLSYYGVDV
jgi:hypothetical protein